MQAIQHLAQFAGVSLLTGIWQGFVLAAAVWLCLRMVPKTTASLRFATWTVVLAVIALLPFVEGLVPRQPVSGSMLRLDLRWSLVIAAAWMALSLLRAVDLIVHAVRLRSLRRRSIPVTVDAACALLLSHGLHPDRRTIGLCASAEIDRPSVIGFFAPRILIPAWLFEQLTQPELEQIVLHEIEHLRRGDDWLNLLQKLSLVLFPLNPILVWVERRLCFERELACDDGVLRRTRAPRAYATCLTSLAEHGLDRRITSLALGALGTIARQSELSLRVHRILRREAALSPRQTRVLAGAVALGLFGGAVGLARCPQFVSFAAKAQPQNAKADRRPVTRSLFDSSTGMERVAFADVHAPHATLLKASAPVSPTIIPSNDIDRRSPVAPHRLTARKSRGASSHGASSPSVQQVKERQSPDRIAGHHWVLVTSWSDTERPRLLLSVGGDQRILLPYAAVPTASGWLIVHL